MNNFLRFLKEYELLAEQNHTLEVGTLPSNKKDGPIEYHKVSVNRAQIIFKNTT